MCSRYGGVFDVQKLLVAVSSIWQHLAGHACIAIARHEMLGGLGDDCPDRRIRRLWSALMRLSQVLGLVGTCIVAPAYIPQIRHLIKEHCSAGISIRAYSLWFLAALFFLAYAGMIGDIVFIVAQVLNLVAICAIVIYVKKYENKLCIMPRNVLLDS